MSRDDSEELNLVVASEFIDFVLDEVYECPLVKSIAIYTFHFNNYSRVTKGYKKIKTVGMEIRQAFIPYISESKSKILGT